MIGIRFLFCLLLIPAFSIYAESITPENIEVISLGYACDASIAIKELGLRKKSYPFDWLRTSFSALYKAIEDDFQHIFTDLKFDENIDLFDYYGLQYGHEQVTATDLEKGEFGSYSPLLLSVKEKYDRRSARFIDTCRGNKKIIFVRYGITEYYDLLQKGENVRERQIHEAIQLKNLLLFKYPSLDFLLIVIAWDPSKNNDSWHIEYVRNYVQDHEDHACIKKIIDQVVQEISRSG